MTPGTKEYRNANMREMLAWDLDKKINHALKRIKEFNNYVDGNTYIAFSGGKDSCVLKHLVHSLYPDAPFVFSNTTNELPEILDFNRSFADLIWVNPKMNFNDTVREYGFPLTSKMVARKLETLRNPTEKNWNTRNLYLTGVNRKGEYHAASKLAEKWKFLIDAPFSVTKTCCDVLKKEPMQRFQKETGLFPFIGTQVGESDLRKKNWLDNGCNIIDGKHPAGRPLSIWTEDDIWDYIRRFNVPYSTAYDDKYDVDGNLIAKGEKRTGCAYCFYGIEMEKPDELGHTRQDRLRIRKPKQYEKMMKLENNGVTFEEAIEIIKEGW